MCSQISHSVLESQIQTHPMSGQRSRRMYGTNKDLSKSWIWQPEKCNSIATYTLVLTMSTSSIAVSHEYLRKGFCAELMHTTLVFSRCKIQFYVCSEWNDRTCFYRWSQGLYSELLEGAKSKVFWWTDLIHVYVQRHWKDRTVVLLGARVRVYVVERESQHTQGKWDKIALQMVDIFKCHNSHPIFVATEPLSLGQLRKGWRNCNIQGGFTQQEASQHVFVLEFANGMISKFRYYFHREQPKTKSTSISNPSNWHEFPQNSKQCHELEATRCTRRESRNDDSEGFRRGSIFQNGGSWATLHPKKFSMFEITSSSHRSCQDWTSGWKWSIQICRNFGYWSTSTVTTTRKFEVLGAYQEELNDTHNNLVLTETDHQHFEAALPPSVVNLQTKFAASRRSCDIQVMNPTDAKCSEHAQYWAKKIGWLHMVVLTNTAWSIVWIKNETIIYIRALQGHNHGARINPTLFSSTRIPLNWKEDTFHMGSSSKL